MGLLKERETRANAFKGKAESFPAYTVVYDANYRPYNSYEVGNNRKQGRKSGCRYLIQVLVAKDSLPVAFFVLEKCFAEREDAKNCIRWLAEEPPQITWAHVYYIKDDGSLMLKDSYNPFRAKNFESWEKDDKTIISQEAALTILDRIDKVRRDASKDRYLSTDYYLRVAACIVAEAGGFEDRTDWTNILKYDLTSEYAKDYDDPRFAATF